MGPGRLETCWSCRRPVFLAERLVAGGKLRHRTCFTCKRCGHQLNLVGSYETEEGDFVCETCPDEEKPAPEQAKPVEQTDLATSQRDEYSLNFEEALDSLLQSRTDDKKSEFLNNLIGDNQDGAESAGKTDSGNDQTLTIEMEDKFKKLHEITHGDLVGNSASVDDIKKEVSLIIDKIIEEAIQRIDKEEDVKEEEPDVEQPAPSPPASEMKVSEKTEGEPIQAEEEPSHAEEEPTRTEEEPSLAEEEPTRAEEEPSHAEEEYPEDLNPFADEEETAEMRKPPVPATRNRASAVSYNKDGQKIIQAPKVNLNPFWSDGEPSSEEEDSKPVPAPRTSLRPQDRSKFGSNTSLNSYSSSVSTSRRKKGPAPLPPPMISPPSPASNSSTPLADSSRSPVSTYRTHRKSKPAPPPPVKEAHEPSAEKKEKNYENKMKQNLTSPDKSTYGKWKRKKGQAPSLPIPQRRRITPLPLPDLFRELEDLEVQQRELERQGVNIEQTIRHYEAEEAEVGENKLEDGKDVEGLILQLFEIVNQKNELFRRQAELMYL